MQQLLLHRLLQSGTGGLPCYRVGDKAQAVAGVSGQADTGAAQQGGGDEAANGSHGGRGGFWDRAWQALSDLAKSLKKILHQRWFIVFLLLFLEVIGVVLVLNQDVVEQPVP